MGPSTLCDQCGKKLKVFSKRTKCMHCMAAVCKACYAPHVITRHPTAVRSTAETSASASSTRTREHQRHGGIASNSSGGAAAGRATIATAYELHGDSTSDDDVHFLSPVHANEDGSVRLFDNSDIDDNDDDDDRLLDGLDDVELVSAGEDNDDDDVDDDNDLDDDDDDDVDVDVEADPRNADIYDEDDDDDDEDDIEPYLPGDTVRATRHVHARRMSVEEEHHQHAELLAIQDAVATWARKEADATRAQRIAKRDSCYSMTPIPNVRSTREYQERELFVVTYAVAVTLLVWAVYVAAYFAYIRVRSEIVRVAL